MYSYHSLRTPKKPDLQQGIDMRKASVDVITF